MKLIVVLPVVLFSITQVSSFSPCALNNKTSKNSNTKSEHVLQLSQHPESSSNNDNDQQQQHGYNANQSANNPDNEDDGTLKANRWSKFAPDASLSTDDFKSQLRENMKADLERRRREDPNRGNQPAKSYLDSL
mmetsp:Transcript_1659/g.2194  ORF Transcript_1659/g.2194 Transcript_1659/m.2194 type:complete len:134 (+) Transcript_1659:56-457(+)